MISARKATAHGRRAYEEGNFQAVDARAASGTEVARGVSRYRRHREERSDEAIQGGVCDPWIASLRSQ